MGSVTETRHLSEPYQYMFSPLLYSTEVKHFPELPHFNKPWPVCFRVTILELSYFAKCIPRN